MALTFTSFASGDLVEAAELQNRLNTIEEFVNEDVTVTDFTGDAGWIKQEHLYKPEFYGAPNPRLLAPSSDVYYRYVPGGHPHFHPDSTREGQVVWGSAVTFKVPADDTTVRVMANLWVYEIGGEMDADTSASGSSWSVDPLLWEDDDTHAAAIAVRWDNGNDWDGTRRHIHIMSTQENLTHYAKGNPASGKVQQLVDGNNIFRKNISMVAMNTLDQGPHSVGIYVTPTAPSKAVNKGMIEVEVRSMVVEVFAKYTRGNHGE